MTPEQRHLILEAYTILVKESNVPIAEVDQELLAQVQANLAQALIKG